jgi:transposase
MAQDNKKDISDNKKRDVIHLHYICRRKQAEIASDLRISLSSVKKILGCYRHESEGSAVPTLQVRGRPRISANVDVRAFTQ